MFAASVQARIPDAAMMKMEYYVCFFCLISLGSAGQVIDFANSSYSNTSASKFITSTRIWNTSHLSEGGAEPEGNKENAAYALGISTLGILCLLFFLQWLQHSQTPEIRQGTWSMMHGTVSIFFGVVFYNSVSEFYDFFVSAEKARRDEIVLEPHEKMLFAGSWVFFWYVVFVFFLALAAGFCCGHKHRDEIVKSRHRLDKKVEHADAHEKKVFQVFWTWILMGPFNKHGSLFNHRLRFMKSFLCFAHAMAFAGIAKWSLKNHIPESQHWTAAAGVIFRALGSHIGYFLLLPWLFWTGALKFLESETTSAQQGGNPGTPVGYQPLSGEAADPGCSCWRKCSQFPTWCWNKLWTKPEYDELIEAFQDKRIDGENDYMALTLSSLVTQMIYLAFSKNVPDEEDEDQPFEHNSNSAEGMYFISLLFLILALFLFPQRKRMEKHFDYLRKENHGGFIGWCEMKFSHLIARLLNILIATSLMSFAWCFRYASQWLLAKWSLSRSDPTVLTVLLAVAMNLFAFIMALLADWTLYFLEHRFYSNERYQQFAANSRGVLKGFLNFSSTTMGLLLGFTWEANFDEAIEHVSENMKEHRKLLKASLAILLVVVAVPVWTNRIIPMSEIGFKDGYRIQQLKWSVKRMLDQRKERRGAQEWDSLPETAKREFAEVKDLLDDLINGNGSSSSTTRGP
mmetsp:Transcript_22453/g.39609  ORF Transcript_22453/g.39609 Transcript_22453/m.39609 type:complete len:684 (+) Transcript_22453:2-2053(+)